MRRDEGFTMIEVLITVAILALVLTPMAMAFGYAASTQEHADEMVRGAQSPRLLSAYLVTDVQSADDVDVVAPVVATCPVPAGATPVLGLIYRADPWPAEGPGAVEGSVTYARVDADGPGLIRRACGNASGPAHAIVAVSLESPVIAVAANAPVDCPGAAAVTITVDPVGLPSTSVTAAQRLCG
jgi:prepilin-type N-terminal cleavage/methylation domain-containing protein